MNLAFTLSMPNRGSASGRWSGQDNLYVIVKAIRRAKKAQERASTLPGSYYYNFGDGWGASVECRQVTIQEARRLRRKSQGFSGYDWMVESIMNHGRILNDAQIKELNQKAA